MRAEYLKRRRFADKTRYHRPLAYSIPEWLANDYAKFYEKYPALSSVGGNTNGVNTFTGVDVGNLTGGVINAQNLLDGDNFACFCWYP